MQFAANGCHRLAAAESSLSIAETAIKDNPELILAKAVGRLLAVGADSTEVLLSRPRGRADPFT
jgi:hypothetical protein